MSYKLWSITELNLLRELYPKMKLIDVAKKLGRTPHATSNKIRIIGLKKGIKEQQRKQVLDLREKTDFPNHVIAKEVGISTGSVYRIVKAMKLPYRPNGRFRKLELLKGFHYKGNHSLRTRYQLLYAYHQTCWDCKKTFVSESDLQIHHDFTKLPIQVLVLCKSCHEARHERD